MGRSRARAPSAASDVAGAIPGTAAVTKAAERRAGWWRAPLVFAGVALVLAALIVSRVVWVRGRVLTAYAEQLENGLPHTARIVDTWVGQRRTQAVLLAMVARQEQALFAGDGAAAQRASRRVEAVLRSVLRDEGNVGAWLVDSTGRVLAVAAAAASSPAPVLGDGPSTAPVQVVSSGGAALDFRAPVSDALDSTRHLAEVIVRADPAKFFRRELNPTGERNRTGRTSVVARQDDSVIVLASASRAPTGALPRISWTEAPAHVRAALGGERTRGVAPADDALFGRAVVYAAQPLGDLGWAVVRQRERAELMRVIRPGILIETAVWAVISLLGLFAAGSLWRARRQRREQDLVRLRADFVSGVSHELRTPLAQIRLFAQLLRAGTLRTQEDADRALRVIDQEARRLTFLVDNVLNFASGERAQQRVEPVVTEVVTEVIDVLEAFEPLAEERGSELREDLQSGLYALVDPRALRQVLLNFLDNAVKYGPRGQTVTVGASMLAGRVRVWVDDEGPGVDPDERENVWRPFYRVERGGTPVSGNGIGLAVVHELVLQHGGTVWVEDAPEGGARFVAEFPAAERTPTPAQSMLAAVRPANGSAHAVVPHGAAR